MMYENFIGALIGVGLSSWIRHALKDQSDNMSMHPVTCDFLSGACGIAAGTLTSIILHEET